MGIRNFLKHTPFRPIHIGLYVRRTHMRKIVKIPRGAAVLDAGCGPGLLLDELAQMYPDATYTGYDLDPQQFHDQHPHGAPANVSVQAADLLAIDDHDRYDYIIAMHTLEHIPGNRKVLENLYTALRPGGTIYVEVPYEVGRRLYVPRRWLQEFADWADEQHIGEQYSLAELTALMREIGFEIIRGEYANGPLARFAWQIDRSAAKRLWLRSLLAPGLKALALIDLALPQSSGNVCVLARKTEKGSGVNSTPLTR